MKWLVIIGAVVAGLLLWSWVAYPSYSYAFRLIVDVDTPSGVKTGSSVISLTWRSQTPIGPRSADSVILTGHSLGGGLAGFISGLYGLDAMLFDNMPFEPWRRTYDKEVGGYISFESRFARLQKQFSRTSANPANYLCGNFDDTQLSFARLIHPALACVVEARGASGGDTQSSSTGRRSFARGRFGSAHAASRAVFGNSYP